jgi:hypothetical protein
MVSNIEQVLINQQDVLMPPVVAQHPRFACTTPGYAAIGLMVVALFEQRQAKMLA